MKLYDKTVDYLLKQSKKKGALKVLYFVSTIESFIFPVPPDVFLAPIASTRKYNWILLGINTTISSVIGGIIGYFIGKYLFYDFIVNYNLISIEKIDLAKALFIEHGFMIIFIAGFTPIPYKIFTITAGIVNILFVPFIIASFVGRGLRFLIVSSLFHYYGMAIAESSKKYFDIICLILVIIAFIYISLNLN